MNDGRVIGLIGGISWTSTATYYRLLNERTAARLGDHRQPRLLLASVDFATFVDRQARGGWDDMARELGEIAHDLEVAGARVIGICANTMHLVAPAVKRCLERAVLVDLIEATGAAARRRGIETLALLATSYVAEGSFFVDGLRRAGIDAVLPGREDQAELQRIIYDELTRGSVLKASRTWLADLCERMFDAGALGAALACTELGLLLADGDVSAPLIDTTSVHVDALLAAVGILPR